MWTLSGFVDEISPDFTEQCRVASGLGLTHVELRSAWDVNILDLEHAQLTTMKETLAEHGIPAEISAESAQLAGVQAAVGAGLGVALMATLGQTPEGLTPRDDLPKPRPLTLNVWSRPGLSPDITSAAVRAVARLLVSFPPVSVLAKGA